MQAHAIVIGGSVAGLSAAQAVAGSFERVTLLERDVLPEVSELRKGAPQARHIHVLLTRGRMALETLFPGLQDELERRGAPLVDWVNDVAALTEQGWMPRYASPLTSRACTRSLLEHVLRTRVRANPKITIIDGVQVESLGASTDLTRVTSVHVRPRGGRTAVDADDHIGGLRELSADLVIDASGRSSRAPEWLRGLGYDAPDESVVNAKLAYASRTVRLPAAFQPGWKVLLQRLRSSRGRRGGGIYPTEDGNWLVTLGGAGNDQPAIDEAGFADFARRLRPEGFVDATQPLLHELLRSAEPLTPIVGYQRTENRWRHYERLNRLPDGFVLIGDAVCAFNPVYGQGMSVAALGAQALQDALRGGFGPGFAQRFQRTLARQNATPWLLATGDDARSSGVVDDSLVARLKRHYIEALLTLGGRDVAAHYAFMRVAHLVAGPGALFAPALAARVLAHMAVQTVRARRSQTAARRFVSDDAAWHNS